MYLGYKRGKKEKREKKKEGKKKYTPHKVHGNKEEVLKRKEFTLQYMLECGEITLVTNNNNPKHNMREG